MTWHRGFLICNCKEAESVEVALNNEAQNRKLIQQGGKTAFAFAARSMPQLAFPNMICAGVDESSGSLALRGDPHFRTGKLTIRVGYTVGLSLRTNDARRLHVQSPWKSLFRSLGTPSEKSTNSGQVTFRWDIDQRPLHCSKIDKVSRTLHALADIHDARKLEHYIAAFDSGFGIFRGELEPSGDTFCGPDIYLRIDWTDSNGSRNSFTANTCEFMASGDDLPDDDLGP